MYVCVCVCVYVYTNICMCMCVSLMCFATYVDYLESLPIKLGLYCKTELYKIASIANC